MPKSMTGKSENDTTAKPTAGAAVGLTGFKPLPCIERSSVSKGEHGSAASGRSGAKKGDY